MNQHNNLIQWKNLTKEQQDGFDFTRPEMYEVQTPLSIEWKPGEAEEGALLHYVYRLKIVDDEWYYYVSDGGHAGHRFINGGKIAKGKDVRFILGRWGVSVLRPAKTEEVPKPIPHGEDLVGYLCGVSDESNGKAASNSFNLINCFLITGFSSCGSNRFQTNMDRPNFVHAYPVPADKIKQLKNLEEE